MGREDGADDSLVMEHHGPRSAAALLQRKPAKSGEAKKASNSMLVTLLPCWFNLWQPRFLVLAGRYLFRFKAADSEVPKGAPIDLQSASIELATDDRCMFTITSLQKTYKFMLADPETCLSWVKAVRARQAAGVREDMGHAKQSSASAYANSIASRGRPGPRANYVVPTEPTAFNPMAAQW